MIRILTYNIHKGFASGNRQFVLDRIREAIQSTAADIVFLQEVIGFNSEHAQRHTDWPSESQFEFLADSIWSHHAYGKNAVYEQGHHGNAILSKWPIRTWKNYDISAGPYEQRGLLHVELEHPQTLHCFCTHAALFRKARRYQFNEIARIIETLDIEDCPKIIAGDFNDWQGVACEVFARRLTARDAHKTLHNKLARTFPCQLPLFRLDRVYVANAEIHSVQVLRGAPWRTLSDHLPIVAELKL